MVALLHSLRSKLLPTYLSTKPNHGPLFHGPPEWWSSVWVQCSGMEEVTKKRKAKLPLKEVSRNFPMTFLFMYLWPELHYMTISSYKYYWEMYFLFWTDMYLVEKSRILLLQKKWGIWYWIIPSHPPFQWTPL